MPETYTEHTEQPQNTVDDETRQETTNLQSAIINTTFDKILKDPDRHTHNEDAEKKLTVLQEAFAKNPKDRSALVASGLSLLTTIRGAKRNEGFTKTAEYTKNLNLTNQTPETIQTMIKTAKVKIDGLYGNKNLSIGSLSDIADMTYILGQTLDTQFSQKNEKKNEKEKLEPKTKEYEYAKLVHGLTGGDTNKNLVGTVLNIGSGGGDNKDGALRDMLNKGQTALYKNDDGVSEHTAIITETNPIKITHAVGDGVQTVSLEQYLFDGKKEHCNIAAMDTGLDETQKQEAAKKAKAEEGKSYDRKGMVEDTLAKERTNIENGSWYCSELVLHGMDDPKGSIDKKIMRSGQLLQIWKPTYASTIVNHEYKK